MIFIDTTFFVGSADKSDDYHQSAVQLISKLVGGNFGKALTTDFILNETAALLSNRPKISHSEVKEAVEILLSSFHIEVIYMDEALLKEALKIFGQYKGDLSLTDAASVLIMQKYNIKEIYSHDSDFDRVAGVIRKV